MNRPPQDPELEFLNNKPYPRSLESWDLSLRENSYSEYLCPNYFIFNILYITAEKCVKAHRVAQREVQQTGIA